MTRTLSALALAISFALPAQALTFDLPNLSFPDTVTTPSTKGCDPVQDTATCPAQN